jgi:hypothetical protein
MASYSRTTLLGGSPHSLMSLDVVRQPLLTGVVSSRYVGWCNVPVRRNLVPLDFFQMHSGKVDCPRGS